MGVKSMQRWLALAAAGQLMAACTGQLGDSNIPDFTASGSGGSILGSGGNGGSGSGGRSEIRPPTETGFDPSDEASADTPAVTTRVARLTHSQWQNSLHDLLKLDVSEDYTALLREDPRQAGFLFDNDGSALVVDGALLDGYERAASDLAQQVTADSALMDALVPTSGSDTERRDAFLEEFITRAHRHPATDADLATYRALFDEGPNLYDGMTGFDAGVRAVIEAALQSPNFLYRVERSQAVEFGVIPLDSYEVAVRLSYALWNTMPDDTLLAAAARDELTRADGLETQARRMLDDPRATKVLLSFHDQLLETDKFENIDPSATFFTVSPQLGEHALTEQTKYLEEILVTQQGSLADVLTSTDTFVNQELATIYGLSGSFDDTFKKVQLDGSERAGIFTHVGFLAANASSVDPDPIHRGKFLAERIACLPIAAPPVVVPPPPRVSDKTNRQRIEEYTEADGSECAACHKPLINPFGFPFENLDAIGTFRTEDQGLPVQTDAAPLLDGAPMPVDDAVDLAHALANSKNVHECYTQHALEFIYGRPHTTTDTSLVDRLAMQSLDDDLAVRDLLLGLVKTEAFLTRSTEEE